MNNRRYWRTINAGARTTAELRRSFAYITDRNTRRTDLWGSGQFHAPRAGHIHQGLDIEAKPGEVVRSPIDGAVVREAIPYRDDPLYRGVVIKGVGDWEGYEVKVFYVEPVPQCGFVQAGGIVGHAQDLRQRYSGITNHVHVEVRDKGSLLNPSAFYDVCL